MTSSYWNDQWLGEEVVGPGKREGKVKLAKIRDLNLDSRKKTRLIVSLIPECKGFNSSNSTFTGQAINCLI